MKFLGSPLTQGRSHYLSAAGSENEIVCAAGGSKKKVKVKIKLHGYAVTKERK